jgi:hypothetical protein
MELRETGCANVDWIEWRRVVSMVLSAWVPSEARNPSITQMTVELLRKDWRLVVN